MKIVINALSARLGGGQTYLKNLLAHLPECGELSIVVYAPDSLELPSDARIRRAVVRWPTENPWLRALWERFALPRVLARERASVLFCPGGVVATRPPAGCRTVTMFRNMIPFDRKVLDRLPWGLEKVRNLILRCAMLKSMSSANLTIFISDYARQLIESLISVPRSVTIPHGISPDFRTVGREMPRPPWLPKKDFILYVSKFDVYKHHLEVASAYLSLPDELKRRFSLVLVGEQDGLLSDRVQEMARHAGCGDIRIVGPVSYRDLPAVYSHATANLFASSCENCPNILLEALAAGKPVLASNVAPMPEFGGEAVEYFSPYNPNDIAQALRRVLTDQSRAYRLSSAALTRSTLFTWESTASRTWGLILDLAGKSLTEHP